MYIVASFWYSFFMLHNITAVFPAFINRSFLLNQVSNSATTVSILVSNNLSSLSEINTLISSANITKFASWIFTWRSFIYRRNNNAPVPNPVAHLDLFPWRRIYIYLPSYCLRNFTVLSWNFLLKGLQETFKNFRIHNIWVKIWPLDLPNIEAGVLITQLWVPHSMFLEEYFFYCTSQLAVGFMSWMYDGCLFNVCAPCHWLWVHHVEVISVCVFEVKNWWMY